MRRFRRRRSTQIWLPTYGNAIDDALQDSVIGTAGSIIVERDGTTTVDAFPVTFDDTQSAWRQQFVAGGQQTLHDIVAGQEWKLLRVVGKAHLAYGGVWSSGEEALHSPLATEVALGLIVLRTDEEGNLETDIEEHNPLAQEAADDPWVWRRKWILGNSTFHEGNSVPLSNPSPQEQANFFITKNWPCNTELMGSVADGPHIDQKTRRRIGREERLYWMIATRMWDPANLWPGAFNAPGFVTYNIDNRFVGRLSSRMGNRNNASR